MAGNSGRNVSVNYMLQPTLGTPVSGAGASLLRFNNSTAGAALAKNKIRSNESRSDGMSTRGRHGSRSVAGTYPVDVSLGSVEEILQAIMRGTWDVASLVITEATAGGPTSVTTTTSTIVGNSGSWITAGLKVGDVITPSNFTDAANNNINLRIVALTATVITVAGTPLTLNATPDTAFTITRAKKLTNGIVRRLYTIEEIESDLDESAQFPDCRWSSAKLALGLDAMVTMEFGMVGRGLLNLLAGGASPAFTGPTSTTTLGLVGVDSALYMNGAVRTVLTSLDAMFDIQCKTQGVIGSNIGPDVYEGQMQPITGNFTGIREGQTMLSALDGETDIALGMIMEQPGVAPKGYLSLWLPFGTVDSVTKQFGTDGPLLENGSFEFGKLLAGTGVDLSMAVWQSTAA